MPNRDLRAKAGIRAGKHMTAGRMLVRYRDSLGHSYDATVVGQGTTSGLKLKIGRNNLIVDNVPVAANMRSVNAYFAPGVTLT